MQQVSPTYDSANRIAGALYSRCARENLKTKLQASVGVLQNWKVSWKQQLLCLHSTAQFGKQYSMLCLVPQVFLTIAPSKHVGQQLVYSLKPWCCPKIPLSIHPRPPLFTTKIAIMLNDVSSVSHVNLLMNVTLHWHRLCKNRSGQSRTASRMPRNKTYSEANGFTETTRACGPFPKWKLAHKQFLILYIYIFFFFKTPSKPWGMYLEAFCELNWCTYIHQWAYNSHIWVLLGPLSSPVLTVSHVKGSKCADRNVVLHRNAKTERGGVRVRASLQWYNTALSRPHVAQCEIVWHWIWTNPVPVWNSRVTFSKQHIKKVTSLV